MSRGEPRTREDATGVEEVAGVGLDEVVVAVAVEVADAADRLPALVVRRVADRLVGEDNVSDLGLPMAGSEDFAYFAQRIPAAYFFLGAGRGPSGTPGCHHPDFDFDDGLLPTGVAAFLEIVGDRLAALGALNSSL